jgi:hypothetical protein
MSTAPASSDYETKPAKPAQTLLDEDAYAEPQNALTEKFTEEEWAALRELRVRAIIRIRFAPHVISGLILLQLSLPDIIEQANNGKEGAHMTPIVIWGVTLDPKGKKDARASVVLMKWLRARCVLLKPIVHVLTYLGQANWM